MPYVLDDRHRDELGPRPGSVRDPRYHPPALATLHRGRGCWLWEVPRCPLCRKKHLHGGGRFGNDPRRQLSHRVAHCAHAGGEVVGGYVLVDKDPEHTAAVVANQRGVLRWAL